MNEINAELLKQLKSALRYIEVQTAYQGCMTAAEVERKINDKYFPSRIEIGANSVCTLASFDIAAARVAVAKAEAK